MEQAKTKKVQSIFIVLLRYVIPALATITGVAAWIFAGLAQNTENAWAVYKPTTELGRPITQEQQIPELPYDQISNGGIPVAGQASCADVSGISKAAILCTDSNGNDLDPCYVVASDMAPTDAYCFDPVKYGYVRYQLSSWKNGLSMGSIDGTPTFLLVRAPSVNNINDYSPKLVAISGWHYDVCTLTDASPVDKTKLKYSCATGSEVSGGILGDRPYYFTRYKDSSTGQTTSEWIGWILYG